MSGQGVASLLFGAHKPGQERYMLLRPQKWPIMQEILLKEMGSKILWM
jgi:hypothetical protein